MNQFYRVFDSDDVVFAILVGVIDNGSQCRGLTAAGRACDQNQAFVKAGALFHDRGQPKLLNGQYLGGKLAENGGDSVLLVEEISAVPCRAGDLVAKVDVTGLFKDLYLVLRGDFIEHFLQLVVLKGWESQTLQFTTDPDDRLRSRR